MRGRSRITYELGALNRFKVLTLDYLKGGIADFEVGLRIYGTYP